MVGAPFSNTQRWLLSSYQRPHDLFLLNWCHGVVKILLERTRSLRKEEIWQEFVDGNMLSLSPPLSPLISLCYISHKVMLMMTVLKASAAQR